MFYIERERENDVTPELTTFQKTSWKTKMDTSIVSKNKKQYFAQIMSKYHVRLDKTVCTTEFIEALLNANK